MGNALRPISRAPLKLALPTMPVFAPLRKYRTVALVVLDVTSIRASCGRALLGKTHALVTPNAAAERAVPTGHAHENDCAVLLISRMDVVCLVEKKAPSGAHLFKIISVYCKK